MANRNNGRKKKGTTEVTPWYPLPSQGKRVTKADLDRFMEENKDKPLKDILKAGMRKVLAYVFCVMESTDDEKVILAATKVASDIFNDMARNKETIPGEDEGPWVIQVVDYSGGVKPQKQGVEPKKPGDN